MKLGYITVMVRDLERSLTFYQELAQLQVMRRFRPGPGEIAFLANDPGCRACLHPGIGSELCRGGQFGRTAAKSG